jgi:hypothetical protein
MVLQQILKLAASEGIAPSHVVDWLEAVAFSQWHVSDIGALVLRHTECLCDCGESLRAVDTAQVKSVRGIRARTVCNTRIPPSEAYTSIESSPARGSDGLNTSSPRRMDTRIVFRARNGVDHGVHRSCVKRDANAQALGQAEFVPRHALH